MGVEFKLRIHIIIMVLIIIISINSSIIAQELVEIKQELRMLIRKNDFLKVKDILNKAEKSKAPKQIYDLYDSAIVEMEREKEYEMML